MKAAFAFILGLFIAVSAPAQTVKPPKETAMDRFLALRQDRHAVG